MECDSCNKHIWFWQKTYYLSGARVSHEKCAIRFYFGNVYKNKDNTLK